MNNAQQQLLSYCQQQGLYPSLLPTRTKDKDVHQQANNKELESITMTAIAPSQQRGDQQKSTISRRTTTTTTRPKCLFFLLVV
jgi:hypothetical protein